MLGQQLDQWVTGGLQRQAGCRAIEGNCFAQRLRTQLRFHIDPGEVDQFLLRPLRCDFQLTATLATAGVGSKAMPFKSSRPFYVRASVSVSRLIEPPSPLVPETLLIRSQP